METLKDPCPKCGTDLQYSGSHPVRKDGVKIWIDHFVCPNCKYEEKYHNDPVETETYAL